MIAVDVFYVKDLFGLKIHSATKQKQLTARLTAAIAAVHPNAEPSDGGGGPSGSSDRSQP
ncbi:MAG: hypothetical protein AAFQ77_04050 [Myxococcota bacterium]